MRKDGLWSWQIIALSSINKLWKFQHKDAQLWKQNHLNVSFYKTLLQLSCLTHRSVALMFGIKYFSFKYVLYLILMLLSLTFQVSFAKKANLIFLFFLLRKLILPFYSFTLFCIILPLTMFLPEAQLPAWVVCYVPGIMSILNILPAPRSIPFIVPYLLFENTMSVTKFNAMISGLFRFGSSYEWIVTKKLGRSSENDLVAFEKESDPLVETTGLLRSSSDSGLEELSKLEISKKISKTRRNRLYRKELTLAFILLTASVRSLLSAQGIHFYFLLFQGITFLIVGLDLIGEQVSWPLVFWFLSNVGSYFPGFGLGLSLPWVEPMCWLEYWQFIPAFCVSWPLIEAISSCLAHICSLWVYFCVKGYCIIVAVKSYASS